LDPLGHNSRVGPNLPFGGLACGLVLGPLPSEKVQFSGKDRRARATVEDNRRGESTGQNTNHFQNHQV